MKKKKILIGTFCLLTVFLLTGCMNKKATTISGFNLVAFNHDYTTTDITGQYAADQNIKEATSAQSSDGWQVEFYVLDNKSSATSMFNKNKEKFESDKGYAAVESSKEAANYATYSLYANGYYMYLSRIDNTFLYARVSDTYMNEVKDFIKELGY